MAHSMMALTNLGASHFIFSRSMPRIMAQRRPQISTITCSTSSTTSTQSVIVYNNDPTVERRSANYHPSIWNFDFIQSLNNGYDKEEMHVERRKKLENTVRQMVNDQTITELAQLELIDALQRLGIGHIFENEIKGILDAISSTFSNTELKESSNLHLTALRFRLLRQHGYHISSQDAFKGFKDYDRQCFKESLCEDLKGMLSLYEASHFALEEGDDILGEAKIFTTRYLEGIKGKITNPILAQEVSKSLELPLHWRMLRLEARQCIEVSGSDANRSSSEDNYISNPVLIEFAKLNFNVVQATHQEDLREASRWWGILGLNSYPQLRFARDRLMENFLWTIGVIFEPQFSYCRTELTKVNALITTIDDVYDVYGSLEELELFTHAVERWDLKAMDQLPNYMRMCFLALYNTVNEMAYVTMREQDCNILHYLKKGWADLCKAYLVEARWYYSKYTPTLEEYLDNAWISISGPVILVHTYFFVKQEITMEALESLEKYPDIIRWSSMILRLCDDLGTSKAEAERGDVPKSIQCYMHETGESEEVAREYIRNLIGETWKKMNKERVDYSIYSKPFIGTAVNLARMAQCMYQYGDGHGVADGVTKNRVLSLLVEPMSLQTD